MPVLISISNKSHYFLAPSGNPAFVEGIEAADLYTFPLSRPVITVSYFRRFRNAKEFPLYLDSRPSQFPLVKHGRSARLNGIPSYVLQVRADDLHEELNISPRYFPQRRSSG